MHKTMHCSLMETASLNKPRQTDVRPVVNIHSRHKIHLKFKCDIFRT